MVDFNSIPDNLNQPLYWVEVDPSKAGRPVPTLRALIAGTKLTSAPGVPNVQVPIGRQMDADHLFGQGSELALAFKTFFLNNFAVEVWALPLAEPAGGTAATGTITVTTGPTQAGTYHLYIAGQHVPVNVAAGDTAANVAAAISSEIALLPDLPVTAAVVGAVVTLTGKWKGTSGNDIDVRDNYYGSIGGEAMPVGMTITYSANKLAGGAGVPVFTTAIASLGEQPFEWVSIGGYTDSTTLLAWETEYGFGDTGRWGWARELFGHTFAARRDTYAGQLTFGATRNSGVVSIMDMEIDIPTPAFQTAAAYTAKAARALLNDPARPLQSLHLEGVLPAPFNKRRLLHERIDISNTGIATQATLDNAGSPQIMVEQTTYQVNLYGQSDDAYSLVTTLATLAKLLRNQKARITSRFPRHKLADDGIRVSTGQAIATPKDIKAELIAQYREDERDGLVENGTFFKNNIIVERDPNRQNRANVVYPPDLVNQLRILAVLAQYRLQASRGVDQLVL